MTKKKYLSKKGDIPITIFVIGVIGLVALTIISFSIVAAKSKKIQGAELVEKIAETDEQFHFYLDLGYSEEEAMEFLGLKKDSRGIYASLDEDYISIIYYIKR